MSIENQKRMLTCIEAGIPIPGDVATWYQAAWREHVETNKPLCLCLGLRGAGIRTIKNSELLLRRNALLGFAVRNSKKFIGETDLSQCRTVLDQIKRYPKSIDENPLIKPLMELGCTFPETPEGIMKAIGKY